MKTKDYIRLAKLNIKGHKKNTKSIVAGLSVGFIILIPIIVILFGINVSINKQFNEVPYVLYMQTSLSDYRTPTENNYNKKIISGYDNIDKIKECKTLSDSIIYETYAIPFGAVTQYKIGFGDYADIIKRPAMTSKNYYAIIDVDKSDSYFPKNLTNNYSGGIFMTGYDNGFTDKGKQQVIVSENWIKAQNLSADDVYMKTLTIYIEAPYFIYENKESLDGFICKDYTVVGIVKDDVSNMYSFEASYIDENFMYSDLFFTSVNVYKNGIGVLKPANKLNTETGLNEIIYANWDNKTNLNEEYMLFGWEAVQDITDKGSYVGYSINVYAESEGYANLDKSIKAIDKQYNTIFGKSINAINKSPIYVDFSQLFIQVNTFTYLFSGVAIVIAFCAVINLFSMINHNVMQRRQYLTMLRAIGAKDNVIPRLYMSEAIIIVSRASIIISFIGFTVSAALKIIIDKVLVMKNISYNLSIPWNVIIICIISIVAILYIAGLIFALINTYKITKKDILEILNNN